MAHFPPIFQIKAGFIVFKDGRVCQQAHIDQTIAFRDIKNYVLGRGAQNGINIALCSLYTFWNMQESLEKSSASELRWLLIKAIKHFVLCLGNSSAEELNEMRLHSKRILNLLRELEDKESAISIWVNNSTNFVEKNQQPIYRQEFSWIIIDWHPIWKFKFGFFIGYWILNGADFYPAPFFLASTLCRKDKFRSWLQRSDAK